MDDLPRPVPAIEANGVAQPEADRPACGLGRSRHPRIALGNGDIAADGQREIARFELDRSFPAIEPRLQNYC